MPDENWSQIRKIFDSALRRPPEERLQFVVEECGENKILLEEVQSLLQSLSNADSFLETPATAQIAEIIKLEIPMLESGTCISHYEIIEQIGEGGMGEVFLAKDTNLNRKVALKLLASHITEDKNRVSRFRQEAFATSALNHPNIITIHEIGKWQDRDFITTEFIDGKTLRSVLQRKKLSVSEALDITLQITSALAAAHKTGIVHRDIKPENIMIREDGLVKVLDFGIAKYRPTEEGQNALIETEVGEIIGTAAYMSPEQARGLEIDAQTDIWSLGVILYEMLAGKLPFQGETKSDRIAAILEREPAPLNKLRRNVPSQLQQIIKSALAKNRKKRYAEIADLNKDLRHLREMIGDDSASFSTLRLRKQGTSPRTSLSALVSGFFSIFGAGKTRFSSDALPSRSTDNNSELTTSSEIRSLAVLPFKPLDASENYLGLGIADAMIRRISQTGKLIVRPTSAVRRYLNEETDALTAALALEVDAVLEGSVQRSGDRLRLSVNLLRTNDGASLWADKFDMHSADIFAIQDTIAQQVASHLHLRLDSKQQSRLAQRYTANPIAYEYYLKGVYCFDLRGWVSEAKSQMETTINYFKKAIEIDPDYALAHAQLAYAFAWTAIFIEPTESVWAERAKEEINRALGLDSQLAETHLARSLLLWSAYGGYQNEAAIHELFSAQKLNPNVGHAELAFLYGHIGLADLAERAQRRALDIDPTSGFIKQQTLILHHMGVRFEEWFAAYQKLHPGKPTEIWYLLHTGHLEEAQKRIEEMSAAESAAAWDFPQTKAILLALKGDFPAAKAEIPAILSKHPRTKLTYHHAAYDIACIYALEGESDKAVKWLRETAATGFPNYPLFDSDPYLNHIRKSPEFAKFHSEMKQQLEKYKREFMYRDMPN